MIIHLSFVAHFVQELFVIFDFLTAKYRCYSYTLPHRISESHLHFLRLFILNTRTGILQSDRWVHKVQRAIKAVTGHFGSKTLRQHCRTRHIGSTLLPMCPDTSVVLGSAYKLIDRLIFNKTRIRRTCKTVKFRSDMEVQHKNTNITQETNTSYIYRKRQRGTNDFLYSSESHLGSSYVCPLGLR